LQVMAQVVQSVAKFATTPVVLDWQFTPDGTVALIAFLFALGAAYIPWVRVKFAGLSSEAKSAIMAVLLIISTVVIVSLHCSHVIQVGGITCTETGFTNIGLQILWALSVNQGTYKIFPETQDVKDAKAARAISPPAPPSDNNACNVS
jgi:hypothetical protein